MKKKWLVGSSILATLIGVVLLGLLSGRKQHGPAPVTLSQAPSPRSTIGPLLSPDPSPNGTSTNVTVPQEVEKNPVAKGYFLAAMTPISFWGKVIDEKGIPIEGAKATISVHDKVFQNGSGYTKTTDAHGLFSITAVHGLGIGVSVSRDGYYQTSRSRGVCGYASHAASDLPIPTPENPDIFILRKQGELAELLVRRANIPVPSDGTAVSIDLKTGKRVSLGQGDLQVDVLSEDQSKDAAGHYDWRCHISVPKGGLRIRDDSFAFEAPENGYQSSDEIIMVHNAPQWSPEVSRNYFVRLEGNLYARIDFEIIAGGDHFVRITSYLNPETGSRNLEYDPRKRISTP